MSFLRDCPKLESWLRNAAMEVRPLSQQEYQRLVKDFRRQFEPVLIAQDYVVGAQAENNLRALLPQDLFVFDMPGYKFLPAATSPTEPAYGYEVNAFAAADLTLLNRMDAICVDTRFSFACLFTHEAGAFAEPLFMELASEPL